jgi:hypothetical protein
LDDVGILMAIFSIFTAKGYILWSFGGHFPVLVCCTEENLATLPLTRAQFYYKSTHKIPGPQKARAQCIKP